MTKWRSGSLNPFCRGCNTREPGCNPWGKWRTDAQTGRRTKNETEHICKYTYIHTYIHNTCVHTRTYRHALYVGMYPCTLSQRCGRTSCRKILADPLGGSVNPAPEKARDGIKKHNQAMEYTVWGCGFRVYGLGVHPPPFRLAGVASVDLGAACM